MVCNLWVKTELGSKLSKLGKWAPRPGQHGGVYISSTGKLIGLPKLSQHKCIFLQACRPCMHAAEEGRTCWEDCMHSWASCARTSLLHPCRPGRGRPRQHRPGPPAAGALPGPACASGALLPRRPAHSVRCAPPELSIIGSRSAPPELSTIDLDPCSKLHGLGSSPWPPTRKTSHMLPKLRHR